MPLHAEQHPEGDGGDLAQGRLNAQGSPALQHCALEVRKTPQPSQQWSHARLRDAFMPNPGQGSQQPGKAVLQRQMYTILPNLPLNLAMPELLPSLSPGKLLALSCCHFGLLCCARADGAVQLLCPCCTAWGRNSTGGSPRRGKKTCCCLTPPGSWFGTQASRQGCPLP